MEPLVHAMVLCDQVWKDPATGKNFLLGTFSSIAGRDFPCKHPQMHVYVVISDCHGTTPISLKLVLVDGDQSEDTEILETKMELSSPHPLATGELVFRLRDVPFPRPGEYRFQLLSGDAPLTERRFVVAHAKT